MKLYRREDYLQKIRGFYHDTGIIKVITGVRRCGKSCLMETISLELKEKGVRDENIIYLNLDKRVSVKCYVYFPKETDRLPSKSK